MLKEFAHIAQGMLFLHGHFARPGDLRPVSGPSVAERRPAAPPTVAKMSLAALCGRVLIQIR